MGQSIFQTMMPPQANDSVATSPKASSAQGAIQFLNPYQQFQQVMSAMNNPAAFLKQKFPDIPDEIMYDPNRILQYLQKTRGITNEDIQQIQGGIPWRP